MPSPYPRVTVEVASLPADGQLGQDRHFIGDDFVIVLDGASSPVPSDRDRGWYAETLGADLASRLADSQSVDLQSALADSIANVAARSGLQPGESPSSTVAIARCDEKYLRAVVLGDSPIIVRTNDGMSLQLRDDRLADVASDERAAYRDALQRGGGFGDTHRHRLRDLVDAQRRRRNKQDGYWIAEAIPTQRTTRPSLGGYLLMSASSS